MIKKMTKNVCFQGTYNKNYHWDGVCITNSYYKDGRFLGACESNFEDVTRKDYKSIVDSDRNVYKDIVIRNIEYIFMRH